MNHLQSSRGEWGVGKGTTILTFFLPCRLFHMLLAFSAPLKPLYFPKAKLPALPTAIPHKDLRVS